MIETETALQASAETKLDQKVFEPSRLIDYGDINEITQATPTGGGGADANYGTS